MLDVLRVVLMCATTDPAVVRVDRDNVEITQSCTIEIAADPIIDADGNGIVHIAGDNITVEFKTGANHLYGAAKDRLPDSYVGTGITVKGTNIAIRGAKISGFKIGIHAVECDALTIDKTDVSGNFQQRLKSTTNAEDPSDWLWPHANDNHEWITNYGAGICVESSDGVTLSNITAHHGQNGLILDRVNESKIYDCNCSFLSGWGLAMWRSNKNVISRNAFDFCVRGYSHGVYNRGQDSAGILMFEQCCQNVIAENSATHCGDGFFGFAGKEALGEVNPREDLDWYKERGCNDNKFLWNDFSFAAAHGLELTFSFRNLIRGNQFRGNAICGIWGGYSQNTSIHDNSFSANGAMGHGLEQGGIGIEHGTDNAIVQNRFMQDTNSIALWGDDDGDLANRPWTQINHGMSTKYYIAHNSFSNVKVAILLRQSDQTTLQQNRFEKVEHEVDADEASQKAIIRPKTIDSGPCFSRQPEVSIGQTRPVGTRTTLDGRENIIMTEWGPWDHQSPLLQYMQRFDHADEFQLRGAKTAPTSEQVKSEGNVFIDINGDRILVRPKTENTILPYSFSFEVDGHKLSASGTLTVGAWEVWTFASSCDPREDVDRWRHDGTATHHTLTADDLDFRFGSRGMTEVRKLPAVLPRDRFGVIATRTLTIPKGHWRIKTTSDDGIRVWMDEKLIIDDWTWHGPKVISHDFEVTEAREVPLRVEYFELDGHAILSLDIEPRK